MPSPFTCSPVIRERSWKKTQIKEKKLGFGTAKNVVALFALTLVFQFFCDISVRVTLFLRISLFYQSNL